MGAAKVYTVDRLLLETMLSLIDKLLYRIRCRESRAR